MERERHGERDIYVYIYREKVREHDHAGRMNEQVQDCAPMEQQQCQLVAV